MIKRFVECYVPVTACNLRCSYCYVIKQDRRNSHAVRFDYSPECIGRALSPERWGGVCFFSMTAPGETLIPKQTVEIAREILEQGHYVNITTNGTLSKRFDEFLAFPVELLERLHFSFSFHYLELVKMGLLEAFFENIQKIREAGCSFVLQLNLCDEYLEHLDEIRNLCIKEVGALPQIAVTRDMDSGRISIRTKKAIGAYIQVGQSFDSPLFDFGMKNFGIKRREFCYAGDWSFKLYLHTGELKSCYDSGFSQNIFNNPKLPIKFQAVGRCCQSPYCVNSTHFMALGIIPGLECPSYADLRDRSGANWYTPIMRTFLDGKLSETNVEYGVCKKLYVNSVGRFAQASRFCESWGHRIRRKVASLGKA